MAVLAAVLIVGSGCSDPFALSTVLEIETALSQTSIGPLDSVKIEVMIINPTSRPVQLTNPNGCLAAYQVTSPAGLVIPGGGVCLTLPHTFRIDAGDSTVTLFTWSLGQFTERAPPGVYKVQGSLGFVGRLGQPVDLLIS